MRLNHVDKTAPEGLRALGAFLHMLLEAALGCRVSVNKAPERESIGVKLDGKKYWVGFLFAAPEELRFATRCQIDPEAAAKLGEGEVTEESWVPGRYRWSRRVELGSEAVHFYDRSKIEQMRWLENFLRECLTQARSIETPDQPPIPDNPEGA